jgi:hypothetical protein
VFQLPFEVAAIEHVDPRVSKTGQQPGQKGGVDVARLSRTIDHNGLVEAKAKPGEEVTVSPGGQELRRYAGFGCPQRLGVEVRSPGQMASQIAEDIAPNVDQAYPAAALPLG